MGKLGNLTGELSKLKITPYKNSDFKESEKGAPYTVLVNPEKYSQTFTVDYNKEKASGLHSSDPKYNKGNSPDLDLEIIFDGTGLLQDKISKNSDLNELAKKSVNDQLESFFAATGEYKGDHHKPYHVKINWGSLEHKGVLKEFTIDYKMFLPNGEPLRAVGKAKFIGAISHELAEKEAKTNSPDLTHTRIVKAGDTLPLMTKRIYGDTKYYLEVAKANKLVDFRRLKPGTELIFPPIEKVS